MKYVVILLKRTDFALENPSPVTFFEKYEYALEYAKSHVEEVELDYLIYELKEEYRYVLQGE